jgi:DNA-binding transcriptional LysR family regulator
MLEEGSVDLAVVPVDVPPPLEVFPFLETRVLALAQQDHPLMRSTSVDLRALVAAPDQEPIPLLLLKEQFLTRLRLSAAWEEAGLRPYIAMESAVGQTLAAYAETGLGVAVLPETVDLRGFDLRHAVIRDHGQPLVLRNGLGWNGRRLLSPAAEDFVAIVHATHTAQNGHQSGGKRI